MAVLRVQAADDFAAGIVGIGEEEHRFGQLQSREEEQELVEQGAGIVVREDEALVNPRHERNRLKTVPDLNQQRERLARMPHDVRGLGVGIRGLMQGFDRRHLFAHFGFF